MPPILKGQRNQGKLLSKVAPEKAQQQRKGRVNASPTIPMDVLVDLLGSINERTVSSNATAACELAMKKQKHYLEMAKLLMDQGCPDEAAVMRAKALAMMHDENANVH